MPKKSKKEDDIPEKDPKNEEPQEETQEKESCCESESKKEDKAETNSCYWEDDLEPKKFYPKDIFLAFKQAFCLKKIALLFPFMIGIYFWVFYFRPECVLVQKNFWAYYSLQFVFWFVLFLVASPLAGGIARIVKKDLVDDDFIGTMEAFKFSLRNAWNLIMTPFFQIIIAAIFGIFLLIGGLIGMIPGFGSFVYTLPFVLPFAILLGFFIIVFLFFMVVSTFIYPAIIAEKECSFMSAFGYAIRIIHKNFLSYIMFFAVGIIMSVVVFYLSLGIFSASHRVTSKFLSFDKEYNWAMNEVPECFLLEPLAGDFIWGGNYKYILSSRRGFGEHKKLNEDFANDHAIAQETNQLPDKPTGYHSYLGFMYGLTLFGFGIVSLCMAFITFLSAGTITYYVYKNEDLNGQTILIHSAVILFGTIIVVGMLGALIITFG